MSPRTTGTLGATLLASADVYKALLMLVVVLDHNDYAHALAPAFFRPLTFHVIGFLLLPFVLGHPRLSRRFIADRVARYGIPQLWTLTVAAILFWLLVDRSTGPLAVLLNFLAAVAVGSGPLVKVSSGFLAYWFLPTLLGLVIVLAVYRGASPRWRVVMVVSFVAAHCAFIAAWFPWWYAVPLGLPIVGNVFVLGIVFAWLMASPHVYRLRWLAVPIFLLSYGWLMTNRVFLKLPELEMAPVTQPVTFIAQDLAALLGVMTVLLLASWLRASAMLASIGRHSLVIYLVHPFVYAALEIARARVGWLPGATVAAIVAGLLEFGIALGVSWCIAVIVARTRVLARWLTPRDWAGWPPISALRLVTTR